MTVIPVPSNRSSDLLLQARLVTQLQDHQLQLLRVQDRLSTGLRITTPSDDTVAASRAIHLQMLLEQKEKSQVTLRAANDFFKASDSVGAQMSDLLIEARGLVLGVMNSTSTDTERAAVASQLRTMVQQLVRLANSDYRGRYLFAGSRVTTIPFDFSTGFVRFQGNNRLLSGYTDGGHLVPTNATADSMIGVYSSGKLGSVDLDPVATLDTKLSDLREGKGIRLGSILVSDGTNTATVDLSKAVTLRDVVRQLEAHPPAGRKLTVRLLQNQLVLQLDDGLGGNLTVRDSNGGMTAADLGIANSLGVGSGPLVGQDLDPRLSLSTRLADILGRRAYGLLRSEGANNDLWIVARKPGEQFNNFRFHLVDDSLLQAAPGIQPGEEFAYLSPTAVAARAALAFSGSNNNLILTANDPGSQYNQVRIEIVNAGLIGNSATVSFDPDAKLLTIGVDALDRTEIQTVIAAINGSSPFTASYDASDPSDGGYVPTATVSAADAGVVRGNTGNSGGEANTVFVHVAAGASTAAQVKAALEANADIAQLFEITIDDKDAVTGTEPGSGAVDGLATVQLTGGSGQELDTTSGLLIQQGPDQYVIDISSATTLEDLLNAINGAGAGVVAEINANGTGIDVRSVLSGADFSIGENGGTTATQLGLRTLHESTALAELNHGLGVQSVNGPEFAIILKDGTRLEIDVSNATTIGDVLQVINNHPDNQNPATRVVASLAPTGNGIYLTADAAGGPQPLTIERIAGRAVWDLGLLAEGVDQGTASVSEDGTTERVVGSDVNPDEVRGLFNTLIRLANAVEKYDERQLQRLMTLLDEDINRLVFARAGIGAQSRFIDLLLSRLDSEMVELRRNLSEEIDADLVETISQLTQRQTAFQATLQLTGRLFQLSLLDYL
ncbi:MAG: hypothetical protein KatS3mg110_3023 [Pirellulaceae bacterium]|nr:MAG: hypothetical protein KatS3mg110_3023 [Pirellulaceae bacterium]